jgi:hypothetical protein
MSDTDNKQVETSSKALHDQAVTALRPQARARLARGRQQALAGGHGFPRDGWLLPAGAIGAALAAGVVFLSTDRTTEYADLVAADAGTDMEMLLVTADLDMLSDLDFFLWLDTEPDSG